MDLGTPCLLSSPEKKKKLYECRADTIIMEAIDEVLSSLGQSCKEAIYFQLENAFNIKRQEIPPRIQDFASAIEQILGMGARLIEIKLIEVLYAKTRDFLYIPDKEELVFPEYVARLRHFS